MKKMIVLIAGAFVVMPALAFAGLVGDCYDCHTMHNSEQGQSVAVTGTNDADTGPVQNLLKYDCVACHAQDPTGADEVVTLPGGSDVPQVMHNSGTDLAGGNFYYSSVGSEGMAHNVKDLFASGDSRFGDGTNPAQPPGIPHAADRGAFSSTNAVGDNFDTFTCAGARGCHGTRAQLLTVDSYTDNGTDNVFDAGTARTGIAAISGAHHLNNGTNYQRTDAGYTAPTVHDGATVAAGYRFIPGLQGLEDDDWQQTVSATDHNEYYGDATPINDGDCQTCHIEGDTSPIVDGEEVLEVSSRQAFNSTLALPNNSMSGFCSTCHGEFHSAGSAPADGTDNGTSGAFLRHPSDYVIPESGEYAAYDTYDLSAPVARDTVVAASTDTVAGDSDMVMCLSCHQAHGTPNDYLLRFDYSATTAMIAGQYADQATATAEGGCLACHTLKGVQQ